MDKTTSQARSLSFTNWCGIRHYRISSLANIRQYDVGGIYEHLIFHQVIPLREPHLSQIHINPAFLSSQRLCGV